MKPMKPASRFVVGVIATLALCWLPLSASAISLFDLAGGGSITTPSGNLTFDNFDVVIPDPVDGDPNAFTGIDLTLFDVEVIDNTIDITLIEFDTPLATAVSQIGRIVIDFDVTANGLTRIDGLGLEMTATAIGTGARVGIAETVTGGNTGVSNLTTVRVSGGLQQPTDSLLFAESETFLHISKDIVLDVREPGALLAQVSDFKQSYRTTQVPEPTSAALFFCGSLVVGSAIRRRG